MNYPALTLALCGGLTGIAAAAYWLKACKPPTVASVFTDSGDEDFRRMGEVNALLTSGYESARLNRIAAIWTAISVLLNAASAAAGAVAIYIHP